MLVCLHFDESIFIAVVGNVSYLIMDSSMFL